MIRYLVVPKGLFVSCCGHYQGNSHFASIINVIDVDSVFAFTIIDAANAGGVDQ